MNFKNDDELLKLAIASFIGTLIGIVIVYFCVQGSL